MREKHAQKGLPRPDMETARQQCLQHGITAPDLATVKDFIRFYISTSKPHLDFLWPTVNSINTMAEWFFAGLHRSQGPRLMKGSGARFTT